MNDLQARTAAIQPSVSLQASVARCVNFASHQCDVAVVADLRISNTGDDVLENLTLTLSAEPPIIGSRVWNIDRIEARSEFHVHDRRVALAGGLLDSLSERMRAEIVLQLRQGEAILAEAKHPIIALARNEWGGAASMPELLAAFVLPNDPAIQRILKDASQALQAAGKPFSLEGYQARSRTRSWEILSGIWAAISRRGLIYAEPPASFERSGQKVRFPSVIEEHRIATCLDTALLFAGAVEQAGLYPIVAFTEGHALAGAWLQPQALPSLTVDDPMEIRKAIAQNELVLFETTMATGARTLPFSSALAEGQLRVSEQFEDKFLYAIDIRQARGRDIKPLALSVGPVGGQELEPGADPGAASPLDDPPPLPPFDIEPISGDGEGPISPAERLERWKRSLLDLSKRNRLLNLKPSITTIQIHCPEPGLLEDKLADGNSIALVTMPDQAGKGDHPDPQLYQLRTGTEYAVKFAVEALQRNEIVARVSAAELERGVLELYRKARTDFEEGGANTLFLALGVLRWSPIGDSKRSFRAPLIMLPVRLQRKSAASKPRLTRHDDEATFNLTLLQMLRQDFEVEIPEVAGALKQDEHGIDVKYVWEVVRARVRHIPGFEVVEEVVLSTFSFAKYLMWKDLADRTEALKASPFVRHLIEKPGRAYEASATILEPRSIDRRLAPSDILAPLNADSSQIVAIHASGGDGDFVLEGPPGTGKSETIGNIIAHNLGLGRRVLFVSEKMAALDVVYRRLSECGLGQFCLELHSAKANKQAVLSQLGNAWDKRQGGSPEEWHQKAALLAERREHLNGLVDALHTPGPGGISPREAIARSVRWSAIDRIRLDWERTESGGGRVATSQHLRLLEDLAKRLGQQFSRLTDEDIRTFRGCHQSEWSFAWASEFVTAARKLGAESAELLNRVRAFAGMMGMAVRDATVEEAGCIARLAACVPACAQQDLRFALKGEGESVIQTVDRLLEQVAEYRERRTLVDAAYLDDAIPAAPLELWRGELRAAEARMWPGRLLARRRLRKAIRAAFGLTARQAPTPENDLSVLADLASIRASIEVLAGPLPEGTPWIGLPTDSGIANSALDAGRALRSAVAAVATAVGADGVRDSLVRTLCDDRERFGAGLPTAEAAERLVHAWRVFDECLSRFKEIAGSTSTVDPRSTQLESVSQAADAIVARERRLNVWCAWVSVSREAREAGLGTLVDGLENGSVPFDRVVESFRTAYACWLAPILIDARPALRRFAAVEHEDVIQSFRELDREFAELTTAYIAATLSAQVPSRHAVTPDPGFGVLARELQKKAQWKPVRQLVAEMGSALKLLAPCLMMSPLSVAQFLPVETELFDLVVFDEASQITVPDAIGAIARGKRCIVVGDPRQMPPTSFFERAADDDDNSEVRDLESILDEALAARVVHHRLTGHYRSRHESLICFSNHAYYQGALITYPSADTRDTAVIHRRVNGIYAKGKTRTNPREAAEVVAEVVRRLRDPRSRDLSIGVVTFNAEQQRLIEDLLDNERRADPDLEIFFRGGENQTGDLRPPVFVKNLETVQGDQRDVVLISVGYGPTEPSAATMSMNFGPLNRIGGERRLNVAVTRATTEVVIFTSFDPSMIDLSRTSASGVGDLKNYIDFAARGPVALGQAIVSQSTSAYDSDFEMAVAERLRALGWAVRTQVGVSKFRIDLGIVHPDAPGRFLAGIECDGAAYHSSPSARDRDRIRHLVLEQLGWRLLRLWSTDFFLDPDTATVGLDSKLRALLGADRARERVDADRDRVILTDADVGPPSDEALESDGPAAEGGGAPAEPPVDAAVTTQAELIEQPLLRFAQALGAHAGQEPLSMGEGTSRPESSRFYDPGYRDELRGLAAALIDAEGPITFKVICDRLARAHGFQRTGPQIKSTVWAACRRVREHVETPDGHRVFWPEGVVPQPSVEFRGLRIGGTAREWSEVPYPEKVWLVQAVWSRRLADPVRAVAEHVGVRRVTEQFRAEVERISRTLKLD